MTTVTPSADVLAALAEAFDQVAPDARPACEEELREAGLDPAAVAARCSALASPPPRRAVSARQVATASRGRRPQPRWWAIAAILVGGIAVAWLAGRTAPERLARTTVAARTVLPPSSARGSAVAAATPDAGPPAVGREPRAEATPVFPSGAGGPSVPMVESAADSEANARASSELRAVVRRGGEVPAPVAAGMRSGGVAMREIAVPPETLARLQSNAFALATVANAGRYAVDRLTCRLQARDGGTATERFGLPFPDIAEEGQERIAGCQIMWNVAAAYAAGGGHRGRAAVCATVAGREDCTDLSFTSLSLVGRQSGPIPNPRDLRAGNVLKVDDGHDAMAGWFMLTVETLDGAVDRWLYAAPTRRIRRLPRESLEADPSLAGLMFAARQRDCFDADPAAYAWALLGQHTVLAPLSGEGLALGPPASDTSATATARETLTVMRRPVWVVIATERGGGDAGNNRLVLYIDRELYRPYWKTEYVGTTAVASYACGAAWGGDGEVVAPLTSSVVRFDADGVPTARFTPYGEVLDQTLGADELTFQFLLRE